MIKIHEPYRKSNHPEYEEVKNICESIDSAAFFISGSGSTLMNIVSDEKNIQKIQSELDKLNYNWKAILLKVDKEGTVVLN